MKKATIDYTTKPFTYYDMLGNVIKAGDTIKFSSGKIQKVYLLEDEERLGTDATNPVWIANGRASACEYGCYPLNHDDLAECELVVNDEYIIMRNKQIKKQKIETEIANNIASINSLLDEIATLENRIKELKNEQDTLNKLLKEVM